MEFVSNHLPLLSVIPGPLCHSRENGNLRPGLFGKSSSPKPKNPPRHSGANRNPKHLLTGHRPKHICLPFRHSHAGGNPSNPDP